MESGTEQSRHGWRTAGLQVASLLLLTMLLYQQTLFYLTGFWNQLETGEYAHGYLVLAMSAYLIYISRQALSELRPYPNFWALSMVLACSLMWATGALVGVLIVQAVALLFLMLAVVWATLGSQVASKLMFPILFILVAIPVWFPLSTMLQDLTANVVFVVVRLLRIPAFLQENMITLPAGVLSVEEACSGMRYFLAALTLGAFYGYLNYQSFRARLSVVIIAAFAGILANILRVFIVVYLAYVTDMQHPVIHDHFMLGWYLFGALVVLLLFVDARLYRRQQAKVTAGNSAEKEIAGSAPPVGADFIPRNLFAFIAVAILLSSGPLAVYIINERQIEAGNTDFELVFPAAMEGWAGPLQSEDDWMPNYRGAQAKKRHYLKDGQVVYLYIGYYPVQAKHKELIAYHNRINNEDIWQTKYTRARNISVADTPVLEQLLANKQGRQRLVWYWYNVGDRLTANKYEAKVLQLLGLISGDSSSYVIAVAADNTSGIEDTKKIMREFVLTMPAPQAIVARKVNPKNKTDKKI